MDLLLIGNFVNDVIYKTLADGREDITHATGGSVTYGSLAVAAFSALRPRIISNIGDDLPTEIIERLKHENVDLSGTVQKAGKNTCYQLNYDAKYHRTLQLKEKGFMINTVDVMRTIGTPNAIMFVPVAAEFDETLLLEVLAGILKQAKKAPVSMPPIVAMDVQGFIRTFDGKRVITRTQEEMISKFTKLSSIPALEAVTILKAEYAEATAIVGLDLSPPQSAKRLRELFGFTVVSVTLGGLGGYISSELTGEVYVPTFKATAVLDETGCGDTFLACTVAEILLCRQANAKNGVKLGAHNTIGISAEQLLGAVSVGSCAASFLVEQVGPKGFASRDKILERISSGQRTTESGVPRHEAQAQLSVTRYKPKK